MNLALILGSIHYGQVRPSSTCSTYVHLHLLALQGADGQKQADLHFAACKDGRCRELHLYLHLPPIQEVVLTMTRLLEPEGLKEARRRLKGSLLFAAERVVDTSCHKSAGFPVTILHICSSSFNYPKTLNCMHLKLT